MKTVIRQLDSGDGWSWSRLKGVAGNGIHVDSKNQMLSREEAKVWMEKQSVTTVFIECHYKRTQLKMHLGFVVIKNWLFPGGFFKDKLLRFWSRSILQELEMNFWVSQVAIFGGLRHLGECSSVGRIRRHEITTTLHGQNWAQVMAAQELM